MTGKAGRVRSVLAALAANIGIAAAKFLAWLATGSSSMLAEAIHSVADSGNELLLLIGSAHAGRAPDREHQFGYGGVRFVYGFVVAIVLFLAGGVFAIHEGIDKINNPQPIRSAGWAIGVIVIAAVFEGLSLRTGLRASRAARRGQSFLGYVHRTRQPELPVVLLEDGAALIGLPMALIGVAVSAATGDPLWDALGSFGIGILLIVVAAFLGVEMASMLVGEGAPPKQQRLIRDAIEGAEGIERVINVRTLMVGPDDLLVAAKIVVPGQFPAARIAESIAAAERDVRAAVPEATYVYIEPGIDRYGHA